MRTLAKWMAATGSVALAACAGGSVTSSETRPTPPVAAVHPYTVKSPNGDRVDNYYWLRDDTRKSPEMLAYLNAENAYRDAMTAHVRPLEEKLYNEIVGRIQEDDVSAPEFKHGYWYYSRFEKGKQYPIYARKKGKLDAPEEILLDGNARAQGHDFYAVGGHAVSPNDKLYAWTEDTVGRRQYVLKVKNLATGEEFADTAANIESDVVWASDNKTLLFIEKDPVTLLSTRVLRHTLGQPGSPLVYEEKDHSFYISLGRSKSDKYLFIGLSSTLVSEWRYARADDPHLRFHPVVPREPNHEYQVEHAGHDFVIRTNWKAKNFRIVRAPIPAAADKKTWEDVVPASDSAFVEGFDVFKDYVAWNERSGGLLKVRLKPWDGAKARLIAADEPSYTMELQATPEFDSPTLRYTYDSLITPKSTYDYNLKTGKRILRKRDPVLGGYDPASYAVEYVHVRARDGVEVPVSLAYRKGVKRDGTAPMYQWAYGSYGASSDPSFSITLVSLLDRGFVVALAHIRGGQEMGRHWYEDGKLLHKRNTFTDFVDVTESLVKQGYCAKDKVFAQGGSAGGLLMGAVLNMAPQDYRGVIARVPFVDVVTTMLDESIPLTTNEFDEWGNPKEKQYYDYMLSYSPYDNVKAQDYPALFVSTGLWDSQVQYYEPAKWVAKLRATKTDKNPLLFKINMEAGHGGKSGRYRRYRETAEMYAFILDQLGRSE